MLRLYRTFDQKGHVSSCAFMIQSSIPYSMPAWADMNHTFFIVTFAVLVWFFQTSGWGTFSLFLFQQRVGQGPFSTILHRNVGENTLSSFWCWRTDFLNRSLIWSRERFCLKNCIGSSASRLITHSSIASNISRSLRPKRCPNSFYSVLWTYNATHCRDTSYRANEFL